MTYKMLSKTGKKVCRNREIEIKRRKGGKGKRRREEDGCCFSLIATMSNSGIYLIRRRQKTAKNGQTTIKRMAASCICPNALPIRCSRRGRRHTAET